MSRRSHIDGSECPEDEQRLHPSTPLCCEPFRVRTLACYLDIRYEWWEGQKNWFVIIAPDAGGGGVAINYCPHCGTKLAGDELEGRYIDLIDPGES